MRRMLAVAALFLGLLLVFVWLLKPHATRTLMKEGEVELVPTNGSLITNQQTKTQTVQIAEASAGAVVESNWLLASNFSPKPSDSFRSQPPPSMPELTGIAPLTVMENMRSVFRQYSGRFGGNPVGTNPEITAALNGENAKQVRFLNEEDGLRVNDRGELVDSWGTPFFFHQLSAFEMEIHSAGPDRTMWTGDDLVTK